MAYVFYVNLNVKTIFNILETTCERGFCYQIKTCRSFLKGCMLPKIHSLDTLMQYFLAILGPYWIHPMRFTDPQMAWK
jgi:hypothetical protein